MKQKVNQDSPDSDLQELEKCNLEDNQIESAIKTVSKIKLLDCKRITKIKKKKANLHRLFHLMSSLFVSSGKKTLIQNKLKKQMRVQLRKKAKIRNNQKQCFISEGFRISQKSQKRQDQQQAEQQSYQSSLKKYYENNGSFEPSNSRCYICKSIYTQIDDFYHSHCPKCAQVGKIKRNQSADMTGLNALVTGARIKIGYQICLKLLRDGATVFATTRFPKDALMRYQQQEDYSIWKHRLFLIQCDFLSADQVKFLLEYIKQKIVRLDILINNAAQTLVRPYSFFSKELEHQKMKIQDNNNLIEIPNCAYPSIEAQNDFLALTDSTKKEEISMSKVDEFGQPLDLREKNTWKQKIENVSLFDCFSTQVINSTVPFHLIGELKQVMKGDFPAWVINVSSMEGVFNRKWKSSRHPHTNMAKAALNMITRTCAKDFSKHQIYMNSVDTGWVTNQNPFRGIQISKQKYDFHPPLDCIEGAMRVLDPIYQGLLHNFYPYGHFLKDYAISQY